MPTDYVSDYEALTGKKIPTGVEVKVVGAPVNAGPAPKTVAETPESKPAGE